LADYLWNEFQVRIPAQWSNTLAAGSSAAPTLTGPMQIAAEHEFDDEFLFGMVRHEQRPDAPWALGESYLGYNLFLYRNKVYALAAHLGKEFLACASASDLEAAQHSGFCLAAENVREIKERIAHVLLHRPMAVQPY